MYVTDRHRGLYGFRYQRKKRQRIKRNILNESHFDTGRTSSLSFQIIWTGTIKYGPKWFISNKLFAITHKQTLVQKWHNCEKIIRPANTTASFSTATLVFGFYCRFLVVVEMAVEFQSGSRKTPHQQKMPASVRTVLWITLSVPFSIVFE